VYAFDLLEHAGPRLDRWLSEIRRVLKPGGVFLYNMPNRTLTSRLMLIFIFERVIKLNPPGHHNFDWFMKPEEFQTALARNGLTHRDQIGFMNLKPKPIAGLSVLTRQGAPGGFKLGKDDSLVYVGNAVR
jgi:2-polyprenyl-3-methyl-5-hydroxy-6-metoxy-1,4-benzoquinol methylase